ncbi:hypothetical protein ISS99_11080 [Dyella mobilis]|uniref:Methylaspartate ammonia-lyase n=2 Tax=Dyella mobilis TaxID=1849582 RepID=A0ABS2KFZ2_9GAMM|nr:hypothetical protein [Dyella mobilis]
MTTASAPVAAADTAQQQLASDTCAALHAAATAIPGNGPMLLPSYPSIKDAGDDASLALEHVAFVYDNALAGIALTACGEPAQAKRIADALVFAAAHDPSLKDGRLRNAYRSGTVGSGPMALTGFWQTHGNYWSQDPYQVGTATGNAAWAALLLLTVYDQTHDRRYLDAATAQLQWIQTRLNKIAPPAYEGGLFGYDNTQRVQHWKSTEHNIDIYAAATWAYRESHGAEWAQQAKLAGSFVNAMWDGTEHRFLVGTLDDGKTLSRDKSGLDAQVWPLLAFHPRPSTWNQVWTWVQTQHGSGAGYGYRRHPDGIWTEGTAQVATAMQASGKPVPDALWQLLIAQRDGEGMLYATPQARIATDFAIGPTSTHADFFYYHLPHLGATAWAALAAKGWNPFTGSPITPGENR